MVSGPYQSKLLRLVLGQYRSGLERHRRAVRQTRLSAVSVAVVGGAWLLSPARNVVRISGRLTQRLKRLAALPQMRLAAADDVEAETISQVIASVGKSLSSQQLADLQVRHARRDVKLQGSMQGLRSLRLPVSSQMTVAFKGWMTGLSQRLRWGSRHRAIGKITGVASDLETRKLVLVVDYQMGWDGLCEVQQQQLIQKIAGFVDEYDIVPMLSDRSLCCEIAATGRKMSVSKGVLPNDRTSPLFSGLAQSVRSFWVEVLWVVISMKQQQLRRLPPSTNRLRGRHILGKGLLGFRRKFLIFKRTVHVRGHIQEPAKGHMAMLRPGHSATADSIEADVISASYVEHPLEWLLNRVDQALLWLERRWQALLDWLQRV
ncbi:MAG: hypothetical protein AAF703_20060 [Cyanobacteria bacterium P01_D01_bin.105]